METNALI